MKTHKVFTALFIALLSLCSHAQDAAIRKNLAERMPNFTPINAVTKTALPGIYEVRINGSDIIYTDAQANFMFLGKLIDLKTKVDITDARISQLNKIKFLDLPKGDAIALVRGNGARKMAVFVDPNCGYCKAFERDLQKLNNITVYVYLYPILGPDSMEKSKNIWCSSDRSKAWQDWMLKNVLAPAATPECETATIFRTLEYGKANAIKGTPVSFFANDSKIVGAIDLKQLEKALGE